jgi:hypothetical protein
MLFGRFQKTTLCLLTMRDTFFIESIKCETNYCPSFKSTTGMVLDYAMLVMSSGKGFANLSRGSVPHRVAPASQSIGKCWKLCLMSSRYAEVGIHGYIAVLAMLLHDPFVQLASVRPIYNGYLPSEDFLVYFLVPFRSGLLGKRTDKATQTRSHPHCSAKPNHLFVLRWNRPVARCVISYKLVNAISNDTVFRTKTGEEEVSFVFRPILRLTTP